MDPLAEYKEIQRRRFESEKRRRLEEECDSGKRHRIDTPAENKSATVAIDKKSRQVSANEVSNMDMKNNSEQTTSEPDSQQPIKLLTWNLDGLDEQGLRTRTFNVTEHVRREKYDVIFFQEVIIESEELIKRNLSSIYNIYGPDKRRAYYCLILLRKTRFMPNPKVHTVWFQTSQMMRHALVMKVTPVEHKLNQIILITTHLESCKEFAEERVNQLKCCLNILQSADEFYPCDEGRKSATAILGGDMNLRDSELKGLDAFDDIADAWEMTGMPPEARYTWDMSVNDNKSMSSKYKAKCRFDRIYIRHSPDCPPWWAPTSFDLVGTEKIESCEMFPSDHFGVRLLLDRRDEKPTITNSISQSSFSTSHRNRRRTKKN